MLPLEAAILGLCALTLGTWFAGRPALSPILPFIGVIFLVAWRVRLGWPLALPRPRLETVLCVAAAVAYRLPALIHPWGWVNRDGAYGAFVALHLLQGVRPAPAFTEGANYQGTLKSHLAAGLALITGGRDLSLLMTAASLLLFLVFLAATMALARRLGGRAAAMATGLYLALGPRFLTVFSLNCVGQYVDVLALGGLALALLARLLQGDRQAAAARGCYLGLGALLGAAFWQQPVALSYVVVVALTLLLRRASRRDPWTLLVPAGVLLGALPLILWNMQNGWASAEVLAREPDALKAQAGALPHLARQTLTVSFPILAGVSAGHPWAGWPALAAAGAGLLPLLLLGFLVLRGGEMYRSLRQGAPSPALLPPLLSLVCLMLFWAVAAGRLHWRPRYLLPVLAAATVHLGVVVAWLWARSRAAAMVILGLLLAVNIRGTLPRLLESRSIADYYRIVVRSLEEKGIRTGYADFSLAAPVTMFTSERIVLSPRLGPTPAYESERHARLVGSRGPDAYVLRPVDDPQRFAAVLEELGVSYRLDRYPVPIFHSLSRRVRIEEVAGFRVPEAQASGPEE